MNAGSYLIGGLIGAFLVGLVWAGVTLDKWWARKAAAEPVRVVRTYPNGKFAALIDGQKLARLASTGEVIRLHHVFPLPPYQWLFDTYNEAMDLHRQHKEGAQVNDQRVKFTDELH